MEKQEIEKLAKEFCDKQGLENLTRSKDGLVYVKNIVSDFAEHLLEKGVLVEAKSSDDITQLAESTKKLIVKLFPPLEFGEDPDVCELYESVEELEKMATVREGKIQLTPAKVISDEKIEAKAIELDTDWRFYSGIGIKNHLLKMAKWYREQLNMKP